MADPARALAMLQRLRRSASRLGRRLRHRLLVARLLQRLPVDEIKIDKSFVIGMAHDRADAAIVRSTIDLAHNLGLQVVAEGVENDEAWRLLEQLGCDLAQGFHVARPMPADPPPACSPSAARRRAAKPEPVPLRLVRSYAS